MENGIKNTKSNKVTMVKKIKIDKKFKYQRGYLCCSEARIDFNTKFFGLFTKPLHKVSHANNVIAMVVHGHAREDGDWNPVKYHCYGNFKKGAGELDLPVAVRKANLSSVTGVFKGAPRSAQSGISSFKDLLTTVESFLK